MHCMCSYTWSDDCDVILTLNFVYTRNVITRVLICLTVTF